jgi:hypothetical protein
MIFDPVINNLTDKDIFRTERGKRSGTIRRMGLEKVLAKKRNAIVGDWFDMVAKTYAPDTAQFLKRNKDLFSNPVGGYLTKGLAGLFDQLLTGMDREAVRTLLDPIVRVRAVQNFTPSQATAFVLVIKKIVRTHLKSELKKSRVMNDLLEFEAQVDAMSLFAFDIYMECREKIYELKANEEKDKIYKAFKRAGLIKDEPVKAPAL